MIQGFQQAIKNSWLLKGFLGVVMISFAIWGVGDAINPAVDPNVAIKVGQVEVGTDEIQRRFTAEVTQLKDALGPDFTDQDAVDLGVMDRIISQASQAASLEMAAKDMQLDLPDKSLRRLVMDMPEFKDEAGNFSRIILNNILMSNNLSEQAFIDLLRGDFLRQNLLNPIAESPSPPEALIDLLFQYRAEQRSAEIIYIPNSKFKIDTSPDENMLREIYNSNLEKFRAPERRKVEAILVRASELVPVSSITDDEINNFYNENLSRYKTEPTRTVKQIVFNDEQSANDAYLKVNKGDTLIKLQEAVDTPEIIDLGTLSINDTTGFDISTILDSNEIGILPPVSSDFGWHLFEVTDLSPGSIKALPVVKDEIIKFIQDDKALDEMYEATVFMEDQLAAGVSMKEISETPSYNFINLDFINRDGIDIRGAKIDLPIDENRFLNLVFSAEVGIESQIIETEDYAFILKVTEIRPPSPKPYNDVIDELNNMWKRDQIENQVNKKAKSTIDKIGPSTNLFKVTENDETLEFANLGPVRRFGDSLMVNYIIPAQYVSPALMNELFNASIDEVVSSEVNDGYVIAKLKEIIKPDPFLFASTKIQIRNAVTSNIQNTILKSFTESVLDDYDIFINQEAINLLTPQ